MRYVGVLVWEGVMLSRAERSMPMLLLLGFRWMAIRVRAPHPVSNHVPAGCLRMVGWVLLCG